MVSLGTSVPELAIGNLIGSGIYNIAAILGLTVVVAPHGVPVPDEVLAADLRLLVAPTAAAAPVFLSGRRISLVEGGRFVASYLGYLTWLLTTRIRRWSPEGPNRTVVGCA
jgi:cation:H+ antiporter